MQSAEQKFLTWEDAVSWLRQQPEQADLVRDCYYDSPLIDAAGRYAASEEWKSLRAWLGLCNGRALDVGAGRGIASFALARDGFEVTALEPDPSDLVGAGAIRGLAQQADLPIEVCEAVSEQLPFDDDSYEVVFARAVLHHSRDLDQACREYFRVLKPGGYLVAIREHVISKDADLDQFLAAHPLHNLYGGEHAYRLDRYLRAIESAGLVVEALIGPWDSAVNYAPRSLSELKSELSHRLGRGIPPLCKSIDAVLQVKPIWRVITRLLNRIDNRPGRHYSFIARKP